MAIVHNNCLKCPRCREYVIEIDPVNFPDGPPEDGESPTPCGECAPHVEAAEDAAFFTLVADWETVEDDEGCTISPDMRPVSITVQASDSNEALVVASQKLQNTFGPDVEALHSTGLTAEDWFGLNGSDPLLRVCALFRGRPVLENSDDLTHAIA